VDKASLTHQATSKFHKFLPSDQEWQSQHIHNRKNSAPQLREKSAFLKHLIRILGNIEVCISTDIHTIHPFSLAIRVRILLHFHNRKRRDIKIIVNERQIAYPYFSHAVMFTPKPIQSLF
jgi:hypothetical protein